MTRPGNDPDRMSMRSTALAVALLLAGAGCATPAPPKPVFKSPVDRAAPTYRFTIGFSGSPECPSSVASDWANCNTTLKPNDPRQQKDCTWMYKDSLVEFAGPAGKQFKVEFDPFGLSSIPVNGTTNPLPLARDVVKAEGASKTYTFRVTAAGCRPIDPEIIVTW